MVASRPSVRLVPCSLLYGASCLLPARQELTPVSPLVPPAPPREAVCSPGLSPAEQRVCALLLAGLSNKEIACAVGRAGATIKNQVTSILRKYGVPTRTRLLALHRGKDGCDARNY